MKYQEKRLGTEYLYRGKIINLRRDTVELPNGKEAFREIVEHSGAATCLVLTPERKIIFVRQFRAPYGEEVLELPAGKIETNEGPEATIIRELQEEAGIKPRTIEKIGIIYPSPGYANEIIHLFFTDNYERVSSSTDEDEFLDVLEIPASEAFKLLAEGKLVDAKTICLILRCKDRIAEG